MSNQDVVLPDMGIAAAAAALPGPGRALFACRGAAGAVSSLRRGAYGGLGLPGAADGGTGGEPFLGARAPAPAAVAAAGRTYTSRVVERPSARRPRPAAPPSTSATRGRKHPSALGSFDQVAAAAKGKRVVMFMDYDGTLSPIVTDTDMAFMTAEMREAVRDVAKHFPTAIVTGRCVEKVCSFVGLSELYYAGSHGMDIKGPSSKDDQTVLLHPAREFLPVIDKAFRALEERTRATPGARVEHNKFCLSVHFRCVAEKSWSPLAEQVKAVLRDFPELKLTEGRKVLEIRPSIMWDKGRAVEFLLKSLGFDDRSDVLPVYIWDDRTDEDAFKVLKKRGQGLGILVSKCPKETDASYSLQDPTEVMEFLVRLVEWKRLRSPSPAARPRAQQQK
ncbi:putative trehalose-phosphate phosphatase 8 [Panicum miliaceum]|uniref:Trehalose 6-phosphate phosphatase n=1 Tax=Panicum miliaceum TaxID=4540 RepID=A0A3L6RYW9_PANMI|nr:putative trehalose-phosphate phosphatase 8 [Panicum miliaceum]